MAMPPNTIVKSAAELSSIYSDDGWDERLRECADAHRRYVESAPGRGLALQKTLYKYWNEAGTIIAVIIIYKRVDGERRSIRMLRTGDTIYFAPQVSASPPL